MKSKILVLALGLSFSAFVGCSSKTKEGTPEPMAAQETTDTTYSTASNDPVNLGASSSGFSH